MQDKDKEQELDWQMREEYWRLELDVARQRGDTLRDRWFQAEKERVEALEMYQRALGVAGSMEKSRDEWKALARHRWDLLERAEKRAALLDAECTRLSDLVHSVACSHARVHDQAVAKVVRERDDARHEKAQMQLRLESAEKECKDLRKDLTSLPRVIHQGLRLPDFVAPGPKKTDIIGRDIHGNRFQDK